MDLQYLKEGDRLRILKTKQLALAFLFLWSPFVEASFTRVAKKRERHGAEKIAQEYLKESEKSFLFNEVSPFMARLKELAQDASAIVEVGGGEQGGTLSLILGLLENGKSEKTITIYLHKGVEIREKKWLKKSIPRAIDCRFEAKELLFQQPIEADLVYINSHHSYFRLYHELEHFADSTKKYIAILHTHGHWEYEDEPDYSIERYRPILEFNKEKKGLKGAIDDFLVSHTAWEKFEDYVNSHGFTILKRVK